MQNGRCRLHGGLTPKGVASPHFKTGIHSKYLPAHILSDFNLSQSDEELVGLRSEISLVDARMAQLFQRLQGSPDMVLWSMLTSHFSEFAAGVDKVLEHLANIEEAQEDSIELTHALERCRRVIREGFNSEQVWREIYSVINQRRKLVETESKRMKDLQQMISAEEAMALITAISQIIKKHVGDDKDKLRAISADIVRLSDFKRNRETK